MGCGGGGGSKSRNEGDISPALSLFSLSLSPPQRGITPQCGRDAIVAPLTRVGEIRKGVGRVY